MWSTEVIGAVGSAVVFLIAAVVAGVKGAFSSTTRGTANGALLSAVGAQIGNDMALRDIAEQLRRIADLMEAAHTAKASDYHQKLSTLLNRMDANERSRTRD